MIRVTDLQERVFDFLDKIFLGDRTTFYFDSDINECYITGKQTDAPRPAATSLIFYNLNPAESFGSLVGSDTPKIDRHTGLESIDIWRSVKVNLSIVSKVKGAAKDAMDFMISVAQTSRGNRACYSATGFNFALYNMDRPIDLTELENRAWNERVDASLYFNYLDTISLENRFMISAPSAVELTKDKIQYTLEPKF